MAFRSLVFKVCNWECTLSLRLLCVNPGQIFCIKNTISLSLLYPHKQLLSRKDVWLQVPSCAFWDTVSFTLWFSCIVPNLQRTIISNLCRALWMVMTVDYINCAIKSSARVVSCINDHLMVLLPPSPICIQLMGCSMCTRFATPPIPSLIPLLNPTLLSFSIGLLACWMAAWIFSFFFTQAH